MARIYKTDYGNKRTLEICRFLLGLHTTNQCTYKEKNTGEEQLEHFSKVQE